MKKDIHPEYVRCDVTCGCGAHFVTRSTRPSIRIEVCSKCHPFYTGKQKLVDSAGRVERFQRRWGTHIEEQKARLMGTPDAVPEPEAAPELEEPVSAEAEVEAAEVPETPEDDPGEQQLLPHHSTCQPPPVRTEEAGPKETM